MGGKLVKRKIGQEEVWLKEEWSAENWLTKRRKLANDSLVEGKVVERNEIFHSQSEFVFGFGHTLRSSQA